MAEPTQKSRVFIPTKRASISAILASGKYGHVYRQLSFQYIVEFTALNWLSSIYVLPIILIESSPRFD